MPKISVIIPVYNAEKYLRRCLGSICAQTFTDFEVICINDGSIDKSKKILDEYATRDKRFTVIDKKNAGVSAARNDGIKRARGGYIHFIDADDFIDLNYYEKMFSSAQDANADMVCSGFITDTKYARNIEYGHKFVKRTVYSKMRWTYALTDGYVWRYLFRTEFVKKHKLMFDTKMMSQEDAIFVLNAIAVANAIVFVPNVYYHYMFNDMSALNNRDVAHHKKIKEQYRLGKKYKRDFARAHGVRMLWRLRKILRLF